MPANDMRNSTSGSAPFIRLMSWNIDGINAHFSSLESIISEYSPDVICLQKVKDSQNSPEFNIEGYHREYSYTKDAGVATYVRDCHACTFDKFADPIRCGHMLKTNFNQLRLTLYNIYTPYSNPKVEGATEHRKEFDKLLISAVTSTPGHSIVCGDMNIVASELDCWDGVIKKKMANYHCWERENFFNLLRNGNMIDTFRHKHPSAKEYTFYLRNSPEFRAKHQGFRIDYFIAAEALKPRIVRAEIITDCTASTNNPILLDLSC